MGIINEKVVDVTKEDVKILDDMLKKFYQLKGRPDFPAQSANYVAYLPVFALAFLGSQRRLERLTKVLLAFAIVLLVFTLVFVLFAALGMWAATH